MILAVLEARCGVQLSGHDVYLNVAGGLRIIEPAADLAVAAALVSSLSGAALPADAVYFGEVSLTGAVRAVPQAAARLKEAGKLGFTRAVLPEQGRADAAEGLKINALTTLAALVAEIAARSPKGPRRATDLGFTRDRQ
jgi:DNA repair protein RadA/Sms